jgi:hypothetical protein
MLTELPLVRRSKKTQCHLCPSDLQSEAGTVFRMESGLVEGQFLRRRRGARRIHACVVGSLHVRLGRGLPALVGPALGGPAPDPQHLSGRREPARWEGVELRCSVPPPIGRGQGRPLPPPSYWCAPAIGAPHWPTLIWAPNSKILKVPAGAF